MRCSCVSVTNIIYVYRGLSRTSLVTLVGIGLLSVCKNVLNVLPLSPSDEVLLTLSRVVLSKRRVAYRANAEFPSEMVCLTNVCRLVAS